MSNPLPKDKRARRFEPVADLIKKIERREALFEPLRSAVVVTEHADSPTQQFLNQAKGTNHA